MTTSTESTQQLPVAERLNRFGAAHSIPRKDGERDELYAERMVYQLDVRVEELWAAQDEIRDLVKPE